MFADRTYEKRPRHSIGGRILKRMQHRMGRSIAFLSLHDPMIVVSRRAKFL
jgi:hypothetical protein